MCMPTMYVLLFQPMAFHEVSLKPLMFQLQPLKRGTTDLDSHAMILTLLLPLVPLAVVNVAHICLP